MEALLSPLMDLPPCPCLLLPLPPSQLLSALELFILQQTGQQSIVSADVARAANLCVRPTMTELRNASNGVMSLFGEADVVMCNDKHSTQSVVLVSSDLNHSALISWQDLQNLRVIPASFPAVAAVAHCSQDLKTKTLSAFSSVFSDSLDNKPTMCTQRMKI